MKHRTLSILFLIACICFSSCAQAPTPAVISTATDQAAALPSSTSTQQPPPTQMPTRLPTFTPPPSLTPTPFPTLPPGVENQVRVDFIYTAAYNSPEFTFTSQEVKGVSHWATHLQNIPDKSQAPIYGLGLEFKAEVDKVSENLSYNKMVWKKYPEFRWFFGEVAEEPVRDVYASEAYIESAAGYSTPFTPEFDAAITFDKTDFSKPDTQQVTITITPRGEMKFANITVHTIPEQGDAYVMVSDIPPGEHRGSKGEVISVSSDGMNLFVSDFPVRKDQPYEFTFSLRVDSQGRKIKYAPWISIGCGSSTPDFKLDSGIDKGSALSFSMENAGTWTWSAAGDYTWDWRGSSMIAIYNVNFGQYILEK